VSIEPCRRVSTSFSTIPSRLDAGVVILASINIEDCGTAFAISERGWWTSDETSRYIAV
jgi:hypothetical protein